MNIIEIYKKFPTEKDCIKHLEKVRWSGKPICPYCTSGKVTQVPKEMRHHCNNCNTSYSVTVGTIFHHTHLPLQKWFLALSLILNAKKGVSSRQLARDIEVTKDTARSMQMRVRDAKVEQGELFYGIIEMDKTYIGGKPRKGNNHRTNDDVFNLMISRAVFLASVLKRIEGISFVLTRRDQTFIARSCRDAAQSAQPLQKTSRLARFQLDYAQGLSVFLPVQRRAGFDVEPLPQRLWHHCLALACHGARHGKNFFHRASFSKSKMAIKPWIRLFFGG
jgi:transposase-like protein